MTRTGRRGFQWNQGGWFGAQLGSTCWLLILGVLVLVRDPLTGLVVLACFTAANLYGLTLWRSRTRREAYPSFQRLLIVEGLCALVAIVAIHLRNAMQHLPEGSQVSIPAMYASLLVFPVLWIVFHLQQRAAEDRDGDTQGMS